jgi:hypothetical protein
VLKSAPRKVQSASLCTSQFDLTRQGRPPNISLPPSSLAIRSGIDRRQPGPFSEPHPSPESIADGSPRVPCT